jgi:teichoic acid transport system permease protein
MQGSSGKICVTIDQGNLFMNLFISPLKLFRESFYFIQHIYDNRYLLFQLTKRNFTQRYVENILGLAWAIINPLAMMVILWIVFGIGFRARMNMGIPYSAYLITGLIAYIFFQGALSSATNSLKAYSFLIKNVNLRISIIPLVTILSELVMHIIILCLACVILLFAGITPSFYWFQILYYLLAANLLLLGMSWLTASINLLLPDTKNIIDIILSFLFYLTPIFWTPDYFSTKTNMILKINPLYYIITGYRDSLLFRQPFWIEWQYGIYFWGVTLFTLLMGIAIFLLLKPHFADVV